MDLPGCPRAAGARPRHRYGRRSMRDLSALEEERRQGLRSASGPRPPDPQRTGRRLSNGSKTPSARPSSSPMRREWRFSAGFGRTRLRPETRRGGPHLARRLHHPRRPAGGNPDGLRRPPDLPNLLLDRRWPARSSRSRKTCVQCGRWPPSMGFRRPALMACPGLFRRLPQRPPAGQPDPGPARLFRLPHLRTHRRRRHFPHRVEPRSEPMRDALKHPEPTVFVIFGAAGDLTRRKLVPALYNLFVDGSSRSVSRSSGWTQATFDDGKFRQHLRQGMAAILPARQGRGKGLGGFRQVPLLYRWRLHRCRRPARR